MQFSFSQHPNGLYQGLFLDSLKEGLGIFIWHSGQIYIGEWKNDKIEGIGLFIFNRSEYLHSYFKSGKSDKFGILRMLSNDVFLGEWENGKLEKKFKYFKSKENKTFTFEEEKLIRGENGFPDKHSMYPPDYDSKLYNLESIFKKYINILKEFDQEIFILKLNSEWIYIGFCKNNAPEGLGILKNKSGMQIYGHFQNGVSNSISFTHLPTGKVFFGKSVCGIYSEKMIYYDSESKKYIYAVCNEFGVPILTLKESDSIKGLKQERKETFENSLFSLKPQKHAEKVSKKLFFLSDLDEIHKCIKEFESAINSNLQRTEPNKNIKKEVIRNKRKNTEDKNSSSIISVTNIYKGANIYNKILKKEIDISNLSRSVNNRRPTRKTIKIEMNEKIIPENISDITYRSSEKDKDCKETYEDPVNLIEETQEKKEQNKNQENEIKNKDNKEEDIKKNNNRESKNTSEEKNKDKNKCLLLKPNSKKCGFSSSPNKVIFDSQYDTLQHCYLDLGVSKNDLYNLLISNINQKQ